MFFKRRQSPGPALLQIPDLYTNDQKKVSEHYTFGFQILQDTLGACHHLTGNDPGAAVCAIDLLTERCRVKPYIEIFAASKDPSAT